MYKIIGKNSGNTEQANMKVSSARMVKFQTPTKENTDDRIKDQFAKLRIFAVLITKSSLSSDYMNTS